MSKIFSNGCSFLTPRPKDGVDTFVSKVLAENYNTELFNLAMGGRGNTRIGFTTKLWFEQNGTGDTFAVIGWSSMMRNDYVTDDGWKKGRIPNMDLTWRTWKLMDNIKFVNEQKGWDIESNLQMQYIEAVLNLQNYFKLNNIPYVMYNALPNYVNVEILDFNTLIKTIDMGRFFKPDTSHYDFVMKDKLIVSPNDPHPSAEGHQQWATQLKEFIDANNLRTI